MPTTLQHTVLWLSLAWELCVALDVKSMADGGGQLVDALVRERTRMLHPRVRRGTALGLQHRWWGILSVSLQKAAARAITRDSGQDLHESLLEPVPGIADLAVVW